MNNRILLQPKYLKTCYNDLYNSDDNSLHKSVKSTISDNSSRENNNTESISIIKTKLID